MILSTTKRDEIWYASLADSEGRLVACSFSRSKKAAQESTTKSVPESVRLKITHSHGGSQAADILHEIYAGRDHNQLPRIALSTSSRFLTDAYEMTMKIPKGKVATYGRLAVRLGSRSLSRAVGNAMARNPLPLIVPCHRVVSSTLRVGNYGAAGARKNEGSEIKRQLLVREGVQFDGERILQSCVWDPS